MDRRHSPATCNGRGSLLITKPCCPDSKSKLGNGTKGPAAFPPSTAPREADASDDCNVINEALMFCAVARVLLVAPEMVPSASLAELRITCSEKLPVVPPTPPTLNV